MIPKKSVSTFVIDFDSPVTAINGVRTDNAASTQDTNVYSLDGKMVKAQATSLAGLPSGVYVWKGSKIAVK